MKCMWKTAGHTCTDYKANKEFAKQLNITPVLYKIQDYRRNWLQHINRMPPNRLPRIMKNYSPKGRRYQGRPLKRLRDMWEWNSKRPNSMLARWWWWWWWGRGRGAGGRRRREEEEEEEDNNSEQTITCPYPQPKQSSSTSHTPPTSPRSSKCKYFKIFLSQTCSTTLQIQRLETCMYRIQAKKSSYSWLSEQCHCQNYMMKAETF